MSEDKNNEKKFRTVFGGGYQKSDVNEYIASMQAEFISVENTLKSTINRQKEQIDSLQAAAMSLKAKEAENASLRATVEKAAEDIAAAEQKAAQAEARSMAAEDAKSQAECEMEMTKAEAAAQRERADALEAELLLVRRELEEAREAQKEVAVEADPVAVIDEPAVPVLPDDYETLRQKAEQYDKMSAQIGAVMLKADANAEAIIRNAKAEAEKMLNGINAELAATRSKAKGSADALIGEISGKVRDINSVCCEDIMTDLDGIRGALTTMLSAVEEKYTAINQRLDTARGDMEAAAKTAIYQAAAPRVLKSTQDKAE